MVLVDNLLIYIEEYNCEEEEHGKYRTKDNINNISCPDKTSKTGVAIDKVEQ